MRASTPQRAAEAVGLAGGEAAHVARDLQHLLLEDHHAERLVQHLADRLVGHGRAVAGVAALHLATPHVGVHSAADDRPRPHDRDLHGEVIEVAGLRARQHRDLRARLDLEDADGVAAADRVVDRLVLEVDAREVDDAAASGGDQVDRVLDDGEHAEPEEVDLHHPRVADRVLVPVAEVAVRHCRRLARHAVDERFRGDHHPPGVLREVARDADQLRHDLGEFAPAARAGAVLELRVVRQLPLDPVGAFMRPGAAGEAVEFGLGQSERLAGVADRAARAVGGEAGHERGVLAAPAGVDALDQLGADVAREVEVDVGQRVHLLVEEAPDEEPVVDRVDVREPDQVADDRGDRGATPAAGRQVRQAARDAGRAHVAGHLLRQLEHLVVDEEEAGEVVQLDQPQLLDELCLGLRALGRRPVALAEAFAADPFELAERRGALGQRWRGQPVAEVARQVEAATPRDPHRVRRRLGVVAREALGLLLGAAQPELGVRPALGVGLVEGRAMADRDQHVLQPVPFGRVVVHVTRAGHAHARPLGERDQRLVARAVAVDVVVLQLDEDLLRPEPAGEAVERRGRLGPAPGLHEGGDAPLAAPGEHDQPGRVALERGQRDHGVEASRLLRAAIGLAQPEGEAGEPAKVGVTLARLGQQREVRAHLAVLATLTNTRGGAVAFGRGLGDGQFEAGDGAKPGAPGRRARTPSPRTCPRGR